MPTEARRRSSGPLVAGLVAACVLLSRAPPAPAQQPGVPPSDVPERDGEGTTVSLVRPAGDAAALPSTADLTARLSQGLRGAEAEVGTLLERARTSAARLEEQRRQIGQLALLKDDLERQLTEADQERDAAIADREARDQRLTALEAELPSARQDAAAARQGLEQRGAEAARLGADVAALNDGRADLERRPAGAGQGAEARDRQLASLRDELGAARQVGADLGRQLAEAGQARDAAVRDVQVRDQRLASLQGELDGTRRDAASAADRADGLERRVGEVEHDDADLPPPPRPPRAGGG